MRYLLIIVFTLALFISGIGHIIYKKQRSEAEQGLLKLRSYVARVERTESYRCKGICERIIVSYFADGSQRLSKLREGGPMLVGQTLTIWAKPDYEHAYISPQVYMALLHKSPRLSGARRLTA